jgi:hypothetical protein
MDDLSRQSPGGPATIGEDRSVIKRQVLKDLAYRTIALAIFMVIALTLFRPYIIFIPSVSAALVLYVASVAGVTLTGKMSGPMHSSLQAFAITVFCTLLTVDPGMLQGLRSIGLPVFIMGTVWAIHIISKAYSELTGVTTRAFLIASVGYLYYSLFSASGVSLLSDLAMVVFVGFAAAASSSFIGLASRHSNVRVSRVGQAFSDLSNPAKTGVVVAVVVTYLVFVRPSLIVLGTLLLTVIEWAIMCIFVFFAYRKIRSIMHVEEGLTFGDGHKLAGVLCHDRGELEKTAAMVREFVATGKKDGLVAYTAAALVSNGVPAATVQEVISVIVSFQEEPEPPAMFRWAAGDVAESRRRRRMNALDEMMRAVAMATMADGRNAVPGDSGMEAVKTAPVIVAGQSMRRSVR